MRDILFRGKFETFNSWVYGDLVHKADGEIYIVPEAGKNNAYPVDPETVGQYTVDPETVGQYTGLRDKNENKIFEGDIVRYHDMYFVVRWLDSWARFMLASKDEMINLLDASQLRKIVGNIYDNPELIEDKDNNFREVAKKGRKR